MTTLLRFLSSIALVAALTCTALAVETFLTISAEGQLAAGFRPASRPNQAKEFAEVVVPGRPGKYDLMHRDIVPITGGVIFMEVATPSPRLEGDCPRIEYNSAAPFGSRVLLSFSSTKAVLELADWELKPLIGYVRNGDHGVLSLMQKYDEGNFKGQAVQIHPQLKDTLVGYVMLLVDAAPTFSLAQGDAVAGAALLNGYDLRGFNREMDGRPLASHGSREQLRELARQIVSSSATQLMFTDWRAPTTFDVVDGKLQVSNDPYFLLVRADQNGEGHPVGTLDATSKALLERNPIIFRTAFRFAHAAAFFRYIKASCATNWAVFSNAVLSNSEIDTVKVLTPVAVR